LGRPSYVYLLARAAFREQSGGTYDTARALGAGPLALFLKVGLPLARPAIATGVALALMETVADYGTVLHFGVQTLTTGIFSTWLNGGNAGGAAQIALVAMALILLLVALEHSGRRRQRHFRTGRARHPLQPERLAGWRAGLAFGLAALPFVAGFVLPVAVMVGLSLQSPTAWASPDLLRAFLSTVTLSAGAALVTVGAALVLVHGVRAVRPGLARALLPWTALGYAAPGAVLALGLLFPMAAVDHRVADGILALTGHDPGLLFTGTALGVGLAYVLRFFAIAQGAVDAAHGRIGPNLGAAARALGRGPGGALRAVYMPLMRGSVATAILIVFVDCVKELPATLLLRPFNFETLATRTFELVSLERLSEAAPAALLVMAVGLGAVAVLARANR
jgi:iron(III) transport system permease protein